MKKLPYLGALAVILFCLFPFYWAWVTSLKTGAALFDSSFWPKAMSLDNYRNIFLAQPFGKSLLNSVVIATATVALSMVLAILAAYALSRHRFRGRTLILMSFLFISTFPQIALLSGLFELIRALGLFNQKLGLSLTYLIFTLPFTVWTLNVFMRQIPKELEEAAIIDGAGHFRIIFQIFLPVMAPSLVTTGLLAFIAAWNEFLFALTFTLTDRSRTVPVAIAMMSGSSQHEVPWGSIMAASVTVTLPIVALVLVFQRKIVSGLTSGALKG